MRTQRSACLILLLILLVQVRPAYAAGPPRVDRHGDALPEGAIERLGTTRFRHDGSINSLAFSPDGKRLATVGEGAVRVWECDTGKELSSTPIARYVYHRITFSPDGRMLATVPSTRLDRSEIVLWEPEQGRVRRLELPETGAQSLAFSPDGGSLLTGGQDGVVRLWDTTSGEQVRRFAGHSGPVEAVAWTPDGKTVLSFGRPSLRVWDRASGNLLRECKGICNGHGYATFSRNARLLGVTSVEDFQDNGEFVLLDTTSGERLRSWKVAGDVYGEATFSPDGRNLISGGRRGYVRWNTDNGEERRFAGDGNPAPVNAVAFSPDGILVAGEDGTLV
jgi:WD40 repeat protein